MSDDKILDGRRPYVREFPNSWWLEKPFYTRYMLREMTSFFVGTYSALLIIGLWRISEGPEAWAGFIGMFDHWAWVVYHLLAFVFAVYHTVTWFALTPRTTPLMKGDDFVPPGPIVAAQYVGWLVVSLVVLALVLI